MKTFLIEEVLQKDGSWDESSKKILGCVAAISLEELMERMEIVTTCCGNSVGGRIFVKDWKPSKGWLITELNPVDPETIN